MRQFLLRLVARLHNYLHALEAAEPIASAEERGVIPSSPVSDWAVPWAVPWAEYQQGTAVQPPIRFVTVPLEVSDWTYPTQTGNG